MGIDAVFWDRTGMLKVVFWDRTGMLNVTLAPTPELDWLLEMVEVVLQFIVSM